MVSPEPGPQGGLEEKESPGEGGASWRETGPLVMEMLPENRHVALLVPVSARMM